MATDVTCALIESGGKVLAARRAETANRGGLWEFPGGKVAQGETEAECLRRELGEELGIVVDVARRLQPVLHREPKGEIRLIPYFCTIVRGEPTPLEHDRVLWSERRELVRLDWCPADIPVLRQYLSERAPELTRELDRD
jgi:8-oxo-dGTP diphosphatase